MTRRAGGRCRQNETKRLPLSMMLYRFCRVRAAVRLPLPPLHHPFFVFGQVVFCNQAIDRNRFGSEVDHVS